MLGCCVVVCVGLLCDVCVCRFGFVYGMLVLRLLACGVVRCGDVLCCLSGVCVFSFAVMRLIWFGVACFVCVVVVVEVWNMCVLLC